MALLKFEEEFSKEFPAECNLDIYIGKWIDSVEYIDNKTMRLNAEWLPKDDTLINIIVSTESNPDFEFNGMTSYIISGRTYNGISIPDSTFYAYYILV